MVARGSDAAAAAATVTALISGFAVLYSVSHGFAPAQPLGYQKNFIGSITATVLLTLLAAHNEFRLPGGWLRIAMARPHAGSASRWQVDPTSPP